ncbi:MAG: hypothetical protein JOY99_12960 [Sphingomonadaceae bacterium]|nr:hypothetical protein [Sphingomonadaceae bacterium]
MSPVDGGRRWSEVDIEQLRRMAADGAMVAEIARAQERTEAAIERKASKLGLRLSR